jgi:chromate transport protein ChrA
MNISQIYIAVSILVLAVIAILILAVRKNGKRNRLTLLVGLSFGFVLAGTFFSDNRVIGYGLLGIGVLLAVVDMFNRSRKK